MMLPEELASLVSSTDWSLPLYRRREYRVTSSFRFPTIHIRSCASAFVICNQVKMLEHRIIGILQKRKSLKRERTITYLASPKGQWIPHHIFLPGYWYLFDGTILCEDRYGPRRKDWLFPLESRRRWSLIWMITWRAILKESKRMVKSEEYKLYRRCRDWRSLVELIMTKQSQGL